jgi:hypothetical protein
MDDAVGAGLIKDTVAVQNVVRERGLAVSGVKSAVVASEDLKTQEDPDSKMSCSLSK